MAPSSYKDYTGDGTTTTFSITFDYQKESEITVTVDGVAQSGFTFPSSTQVTLTSAPASNTLVRIRRTTDLSSREVDFASGSVLTEEDLDNSNIQVFHATQEAIDIANDAIPLDDTDKFDAKNKVIKNVANPVNAQDAVTKNYLENTWLTPADKTQLNALDTDNLDLVADDVANVNTVASNISDVNTVADRDADISTVADRDTDIGTVASRDADIGTVADRDSDIGTVAARDTDIGTVAARDADIGTVADDLDLASPKISTVASNISDVNTVAGIDSDVTTVAGISSDVTAVAGDATDIGAVAAKATEIGRLGTADAVADLAILGTTAIVADMDTLADISSDITTVAGIDSDVTTVSGISANVTSVAGDATDIGTVATNIANVNTVAGIDSDVTTVAGISANTTTVAGISANVTTVAGVSSDVTTVAGISADVTTVAGISADISAVEDKLTEIQSVADDLAEATSEIDTVAGSIANVDAVGGSIANVNTVAGISSDVTTVAGDSADISTVAGISANVTTVATNNANVTTVASNITGVNSFGERYRVGASDPSTSLDEGDLAYNTTDNALKYYNGTSWASITAGLTDIVGDATPQLGGDLDTNGNNINFGDTDTAQFGDGNDLQIYHNGTNSYIKDVGTGKLYIAGDTETAFVNADVTEFKAKFITDGAVELYHNNSKKLATKSDGVDITGELQADSLDIDGAGDISGNLTLGGNLDMGDSDKILLGASDDLEIQHSGANSHITHDGTGALYIDANSGTYFRNAAGTEAYASFIQDGAVDLYYNNVKKFETNTNGVKVLGHVYVNDSIVHNGDTNTSVDFASDDVRIQTGGTVRLVVDTDGVTLGDTGNGKIKPVSGNYGSIEIDGGAHNGWEGYSIGGRVAFMHNNSTGTGIYNDVDNEWLLETIHNGAVKLYNNGVKKFETTSSGVDVTGTVQADSFTIDNGASDWTFERSGNNLVIKYGGTSKMKLDPSGNLTVTGNIISEGTI